MDPGDIEVLLLDVNETLSDMEPLRGSFTAVGLPETALELWFAMTLRDGFAVTAADSIAPFRDLAADALRTLLATSGRPVDDDAVRTVLTSVTELPPHPDVGPGLARIHASGIRLATLTNSATSISDGLLEQADVLDLLEERLSVEDAGRWKPSARAYQYAADTFEVDPARMALAAVHPWDIDGARRAGMRGIWIDRKDVPYPTSLLEPDLRVSDFLALAEWFESN